MSVKMMIAPQVVGVLLKKPGHQHHHHHHPISSLDPEDTKIRGELYVEDLGERRMVSIRMGWLWVEGTPMRLALRALNLRQASTSTICQPLHALGFTLSNSKAPLATFWADTEPIYWSWVRAVAAELVRQTPFRSRRCLNFLEILTICPRGPLPMMPSNSPERRRSRSELRCWFANSPLEKHISCATIIDDPRRRARSELRYWSSSNSSDEDMMGLFRTQLPEVQTISNNSGCSESSEGSDDSLPWGGTSFTSVASTITLPDAPTREQRIQRYKEARRRENEARSRRVVEEDARRRKARAEDNNNGYLSRWRTKSRDNDHLIKISKIPINSTDVTDSISLRLPPKSVPGKLNDYKNLEDTRNNNNLRQENAMSIKTDSGERRSRARERRNLKLELKNPHLPQDSSNSVPLSRIPLSRHSASGIQNTSTESSQSPVKIKSNQSLPAKINSTCEEDVAKLLERCQRVDHYVPVKEKLTLFESLSRMGGRLARSTEDLGRSLSQPSPKEKQRARSLHDLNRGTKTVPVREMCRLFEANDQQLSRNDPPCVRASTRRRLYHK